eukprot:8767335-Alexandrium_andersonii.AAC.1
MAGHLTHFKYSGPLPAAPCLRSLQWRRDETLIRKTRSAVRARAAASSISCEGCEAVGPSPGPPGIKSEARLRSSPKRRLAV